MAAEDLLREAGFRGPLNVAKMVGDDERIFVLPADVVGALQDQRGLEAALQRALGRKVWIVAESSGWSDLTWLTIWRPERLQGCDLR